MGEIGSFSYRGDGWVSQRIRHGGRLGGRVFTWAIVGIDEVTLTATLAWRGETIHAPIKRSQLSAARAGLKAIRESEETLQRHAEEDVTDNPLPEG